MKNQSGGPTRKLIRLTKEFGTLFLSDTYFHNGTVVFIVIRISRIPETFFETQFWYPVMYDRRKIENVALLL